MKKIVFFAVVAFTCEVQAQNLFSPFRGLAFPRLNAAGIPNPQQPQPAPVPGPQTRGPVSSTAVAVGAAVGGVIGSNSQKGAEGAAIGGAVGLLIGQMLDNKAAKKAQQRTQTANPQQTLPQGPVTAGAPQIDPVTGLPIDPNAAAPATPPAIDPATGLPVGVGGPSPTAVPIPAVRQALTPRQRVNKLFGR